MSAANSTTAALEYLLISTAHDGQWKEPSVHNYVKTMLASFDGQSPRYIIEPGAITEDDLKNLRPGPIQVVYPLDDEWNAAVEACARVVDSHWNDPYAKVNQREQSDRSAHAIRRLKRHPATDNGGKNG